LIERRCPVALRVGGTSAEAPCPSDPGFAADADPTQAAGRPDVQDRDRLARGERPYDHATAFETKSISFYVVPSRAPRADALHVVRV